MALSAVHRSRLQVNLGIDFRFECCFPLVEIGLKSRQRLAEIALCVPEFVLERLHEVGIAGGRCRFELAGEIHNLLEISRYFGEIDGLAEPPAALFSSS